jgi:cell division protein FtsL
MTPPPAANTAAARKAVSSRGTREAPKQAPLQVVTAGRRNSRARRIMSFAPLAVVVCALIAAVVGQTMLTNGQVRLSGVTQQVQQAENAHRQLQLEVSALEVSSRIVATAVGSLHMVHPTEQQLPYVSLNIPLATPNVTPVPVAPPAATSTTASTTPSSITAATSTTSTPSQ